MGVSSIELREFTNPGLRTRSSVSKYQIWFKKYTKKKKMNFIEEELIDIKRLDLSLYFSVRQMLTKVLQDSIKDK